MCIKVLFLFTNQFVKLTKLLKESQVGKCTSTCIEWMVQAQPNLHVIRTINV